MSLKGPFLRLFRYFECGKCHLDLATSVATKLPSGNNMSKVCEIWKIAGFFRWRLSRLSEAVTVSENVHTAQMTPNVLCIMHNKTGDKRKEPRISSRSSGLGGEI